MAVLRRSVRAPHRCPELRAGYPGYCLGLQDPVVVREADVTGGGDQPASRTSAAVGAVPPRWAGSHHESSAPFGLSG